MESIAPQGFHPPLPRLRLERQMESGEDCLSAESASSAAAHLRRAYVLFLAEG